MIRREPGGTVLVSGATPIRDLNRELGLDLPEEEGWSTVAGLCLAVAGHIPTPGERISIVNDITLEVVEASPPPALAAM